MKIYFSIFWIFVCQIPPLFAIYPPEYFSPFEVKRNHRLLDYDLEKWFEENTGLEGGTLGEIVSDWPTDLKLLHRLKKKPPRSKYLYKELESDISKLLQSKEAKNQTVMLPYIIDEILQLNNLNPEIAKLWENKLRTLGYKSCPEKEILLRDIEFQFSSSEKLLDRVLGFQSRSFKRGAFVSLIPQLSLNKLSNETIQKINLNFYKSYPKLRRQQSEFFSKILKIDQPEIEDSFSFASCDQGTKKLLAINKPSSKISFMQIKPQILKIDRCYKSKKLSKRIQYWKKIKSSLVKKFQFDGEFFVEKKLGLIYWSKDHFDKALEIYKNLVNKTRSNRDYEKLAESIFILAKIEENGGNYQSAIKLFEEYKKNFSKYSDFNVVLKKLTVLHFMEKNYKKSLANSQAIVAKQSKLPSVERDTGFLSFAMYWSARIYYLLGDKNKANDYWTRLTNEYYSTFYGALGHSTLEIISNKKLALQPQMSPSFKALNITSEFSNEEKAKTVQIESLLKLGLKDEASCELDEFMAEKIPLSKDSNNKENDSKSLRTTKNEQVKLLKSMFLYATGEWLEAIKKYSSLPRSFRKALPRGMERLLFPRKYVNLVDQFAGKLDLDSSFILAIIRQESVFNSRARSSVGARGLMQLMPATAYYESKKIRGTFPRINKSRSGIKKELFNAKTNLVLGVHHVYRLLKEYKNPILVLTSYNASPSATRKWVNNISLLDNLSFIEQIPYKETRNYVKLVLRNYFYYKKWYNYKNTNDSKFLETLIDNILKQKK